MRLWACPQTEGSLLAIRKNTFLPKSSSLEMSTPGGGVVSSAPGLLATGAGSAAWASPAFFAQAVKAGAPKASAAVRAASTIPKCGRGLRIRPLRIETYAQQVNSRLARRASTQLTETRATSYIFRVARPEEERPNHDIRLRTRGARDSRRGRLRAPAHGGGEVPRPAALEQSQGRPLRVRLRR